MRRKKAFTSKQMISYRSSHKLNSYLIRTELYPINRTVGCYKYGSKRCEVHKYVTETHTFTSNDKWKTFKINHCFECNAMSSLFDGIQ